MDAWQPIPGETPIDRSGLRDKSITNRRELNEAESRNIADAIYKYLIGALAPEDAAFDLVWALQLQAEMFGRVWEWAGRTRTVDLNLGVAWHQVETQLYSLLLNLPYWKDMPLIEQAARLHHGAVAIHPFLNGNGRWSRMLANIWLKRNGSPPTIWPEQSVGEASVIRDEYLAAIKAADGMDYAPLIALHEKYTRADDTSRDEA
jgi:Fic-DOC domain mobile mystery protein B